MIKKEIKKLRDNLTDNNLNDTLTKLHDNLYIKGDVVGKIKITKRGFEYASRIGESIEKQDGEWVYCDIQSLDDSPVSYLRVRDLLTEIIDNL